MGNYRHKLLVERAMKRLDERTPMDARIPDRFTQKPTTTVPDAIRKKAVTAKYAVDNYDYEERKRLVEKALAGYSYGRIDQSESSKEIIVYDLVYGELAEDGIINDSAIISKYKSKLTRVIGRVEERLYGKYRYINTRFENYPNVTNNGAIVGKMRVSFINHSAKFNTATKEGKLDALRVYNEIVRELKEHLSILTLDVEKFTDQWDNAYRRTWAKDESIAYADLPWAEKTQTTVNEGKDSEKLFGNKKRLNEAIDRMFEDAVEIGANLKTEEEMMSK